jgi:cation-transporting ATPase 13A2
MIKRMKTEESFQSILYKKIVLKARVFARMKPEQKSIIIKVIQSVQIKVAMTGDGANDSPAIKQSNIGISFATADSSFSAHFSSQSDSIACVEKVLLEGKNTMCNEIEVITLLKILVLLATLKFTPCV